MIWSTSGGSGAPLFLGNTLITLGEEKGLAYLKQLATQNIAKSTASARAVLDMVIAEEFAIAINMFNYHAVISRSAGAPVDWQAIEPVPGPVKTGKDFGAGEKCAASPCGDVVYRFSTYERRPEDSPSSELFAGASGRTGEIRQSKSRRR